MIARPFGDPSVEGQQYGKIRAYPYPCGGTLLEHTYGRIIVSLPPCGRDGCLS